MWLTQDMVGKDTIYCIICFKEIIIFSEDKSQNS